MKINAFPIPHSLFHIPCSVFPIPLPLYSSSQPSSFACMNSRKLSYVAGAFLGLTGVIAGAMGAHALESVVDPDQLDSYETAVRFQMYHALFLILLGAIQDRIKARALSWVTILTIIGTLMFSGSIYLLVLSSAPVGIVTPIGGTVLIAAWGWLMVWGIQQKAA